MCKITVTVLSVLSYACVSSYGAKLPSYITPCLKNDVNLNACALKSGQEAIPKFINGDRKYKIPLLDPLTITHLKVSEGILGLKLSLNNAKLYGLKNAHLDNIEVDLNRTWTKYDITIPRLEILAEYEVDGRILILPITGKGPGNLTLLDVKFNYTYEWDIIKKKDGLDYVLPKNSLLQFDTSRLYVKLNNLFNGNKLLGDQMNTFMDENWRDLIKDIGPVFGEAVNQVMRSILKSIFDLVDYSQAFPDTPVK